MRNTVWPRPQWSRGVQWRAKGRYSASEVNAWRPLPECGKGNVYGQKEPKVLVRVIGQAPLAATVTRWSGCVAVRVGRSLQRRSQKAWGRISTMKPPRRDRSTQVRRRNAVLPAGATGGADGDSTASGYAVGDRREAAQPLKPALDKLIQYAAQGTVVHNDDTGMRVLT